MSELPIVRDLTLECGPTMRTGKLAAALIRELVEALDEAVDLRVKLYRNGDLEGDTDHLPDSAIAQRETYARKWSATLAKAKQPI